jgi:hypothetical protein
MKTFARRLLAVSLLVQTALNAPVVLGGYGGNLGVTAVEIKQLPHFCWAYMQVPGATGPAYSIPKSECGYWTNHYCPGLVYLIRFKSSANKSQQLSLLGLADEQIRYTEKGIKDYPRCTIRQHVAASRAEVNTLLSLYGNKALKSPPASR